MSKFVSSRKVATPPPTLFTPHPLVPRLHSLAPHLFELYAKIAFQPISFYKIFALSQRRRTEKKTFFAPPIARAKARTLLCIHCLLSFVVSVLLFSLLFVLLVRPLLLLYFASGCYQQSTLCCASYALICIHCPCSSFSLLFSFSRSLSLSHCLFLFSLPCFGCGVNVICRGRQKYFQLSV